MEDALTTLEQALFILPTLEIDKELLQERYDTKATRLVARALYSVSQKRFRQQPDLKALRDISNNLTLANRFDPSDDTIKALLDGVKGQLKERQVGRHEQLDQEWENLEDAWKAAIAKPEGLAEAAQLLDKLERISQADQRISQADPTWPTLLSEMRQQQTACEQFVEESKHVVALWGEYPEKLENKERGVAWLKECDDKTIVFMRSIESAEERIPASYWRELYQVLNDCLDAVGQDSRYRDHRAGLSYLIKWVQKRFRA